MPKIELVSRDEVIEIGDGECGFTIRRLPRDVVREARKRHTVRRETGDGGPAGFMMPATEVDEDEVDKDLLDYVIQDWHGVLGPDGAEAPCTREAKWGLPSIVKTQILTASNAVNKSGGIAADLKNWKPSSGAPGPKGGSSPAA